MKFLYTFIALIMYFATAQSQDQEISFQSDGLTLNGTLSIPENFSPPYPLAILVHGSGQNDRDQTASLSGGNSLCLYPGLANQTIRNLRDIADYLSENGIAVLRYDKRTFTHALDPAEILVSDFTIDIESAINYGKSRSEIDDSSIFLIGHSQGSSIIPIAAMNAGNIQGLISLAGPSTPIDSLLPEQFRNLYIQCANDPATGENIANQFYQQFEAIRNGTFPLDQQITLNVPGVPTAIPQGYGTFWKSWIDISDDAVMNYLNAGIRSLFIQGDDDLNVPVTDVNDFAVLPNSEIKIYEGINHFLTPSNNNNVSGEILQDIVDWINADLSSSNELNQDQDKEFEVFRKGNELIIKSPHECTNCQMQLLTIDGKLIHTQKLGMSENRIKLDTQDILMIVIITDGNNLLSRIIK